MRSVILLSWILDPTRLRFSFWRAHGETQKGGERLQEAVAERQGSARLRVEGNF